MHAWSVALNITTLANGHQKYQLDSFQLHLKYSLVIDEYSFKWFLNYHSFFGHLFTFYIKDRDHFCEFSYFKTIHLTQGLNFHFSIRDFNPPSIIIIP